MNDANPVQAIAWALSIFIADRIAAAVAPHLSVLIAGMFGAYFGLSSWRKCTRWEAAGYIVGFGACAWFFAAMAVSLFGGAVQNSPFAVQLSAAVLGGLGHRIGAVFQSIIPGGSPK